MSPEDVYVMTEKGTEEIRTRQNNLPPELRIVFFMVDGHARAGEILTQVSGLGVRADTFDQLRAAGFIKLRSASESAGAGTAGAKPGAASEEDRFFLARQFINETVVNAMGLRSFLFVLKLERANSVADLRQLLPDYAKILEKGMGKLEAEVLVRRARELTKA